MFQSSGDTEEVVRRLEADKDRLSLQVTVLTEQIDAQTEKIVDLEKSLDDKKKHLHSAEDVLNRVSSLQNIQQKHSTFWDLSFYFIDSIDLIKCYMLKQSEMLGQLVLSTFFLKYIISVFSKWGNFLEFQKNQQFNLLRPS